MGKATRNHKKRIAKQKKKTISTFPDLSSYTQEELLNKAQEEIDIFEYAKAQTLCQEALKRNGDDVRALEISANVCLETSNINGAKHCLGRAITVCPENGFTKYFSMAQLIGGKESLQCYMKGIEIIKETISKKIDKIAISSELINNEKEDTAVETCNKENSEQSNISESENSLNIKSSDADSESSILGRKLSDAYCSIAELFMSDLCDEPDAENQCSNNIQNAIQADLKNPEAYQCYANFLLVKDEVEEAKKNIKKSISLWLPKYLEVDDGVAEAGSFDPVCVCPLSQASRFSTARILIEVEEYDLAAEVLEGLLGEDDEDVYTWYLLGWNLYLQENKKYEAKSHLQKAFELNKKSQCKDFQVIEHIQELLKEIGDVPEPDDDLEEISDMEIS